MKPSRSIGVSGVVEWIGRAWAWSRAGRLAAVLAGVMLFSSCATQHTSRKNGVVEIPMNKDAGAGEDLEVMVRMQDGRRLPFVIDTGSPVTLFDKTLEPKLGEAKDTGTLWNFGVKHETVSYPIPKLYLDDMPLKISGDIVATFDCSKISSDKRKPVMGILGMDCLEHYCVQLDFQARKIRLLGTNEDKGGWGRAFSLIDNGDGCVRIEGNLAGLKGVDSLVDTGCNHDGWLTPKTYQRWTNVTDTAAEGEVKSPRGVLGSEKYDELDLSGLEEGIYKGDDTHILFEGLGLHFLSRHLVTLDFPNHTMYLKRTSDAPLVSEANRKRAMKEARSTIKMLKRVQSQGKLPGWTRTDKPEGRTVNFHIHFNPDTMQLEVPKKGAPGWIYHYYLTRASKEGPWTLKRAWRTDEKTKELKELAVE